MLYTGDMNPEVLSYNESIEQPDLRDVCDTLAAEISKHLKGGLPKIWYKIPVWFIGENPVVGYSVTKSKGINLLFWSGQAFTTPGLEQEGSFKAAQVFYSDASEIDKGLLAKWLQEAHSKIYNYKDIRKNRGKLTLEK